MILDQPVVDEPVKHSCRCIAETPAEVPPASAATRHLPSIIRKPSMFHSRLTAFPTPGRVDKCSKRIANPIWIDSAMESLTGYFGDELLAGYEMAARRAQQDRTSGGIDL